MTETARRPRVLMLTSTLPRWEGDSEPRFVLDLAKHLSEHFDIELLAPHTPGAARSEMLEGVRVTRFRYWIPRWQSVAYEGGISWRLQENSARVLQLPFFLSSLAWYTIRRLRQEPRVDLIHAHWLIPQGLVAVVVRRLAGRHIPLVTTSHGGDLFGLRGRLWKLLKRKTLLGSDAITVVSRAMAKAARELSTRVDPIVIPMGTDLTNTFVPPAEPRPPPIRNLIFVGRLVEKKGVRYLLEALATVVEAHPDIRLKIVGHGPLRPALESDVQRLGLNDIVSFIGPVPHHELAAHYQAAQIAVFPFVEAASGDQEGFGLVMVEAMGCGCAVVASNLPAVGDVVRQDRTGVLVAPRDVKALASAIESLIASPNITQALAERGRRYGLAQFDWSVSRKKFERVYDELLDSGLRDWTVQSPPATQSQASMQASTQGEAGRRGHAVMDLPSRNAKARKIEGLLNLAPQDGVTRMLEIGTGAGGIANYFGSQSNFCCEVDSVDVRDTRQIKNGYRFTLVEGVKLPFPDQQYDVVISNHVIEHVGDHDAQRFHLDEMRRVLKPGGVGYLAVPNRWQLVEPHYKLAFLSWLPLKWRTPYVRVRGRGADYDCRPLTVPSLEALLAEAGFSFFQEHGRALRLTYELERPHAMLYRMVLRHLPDSLYKQLRRGFPTLIYVLRPVRRTMDLQ
jgi:phosphatidyl-myo-inositol dimannoside synthase